MTSSPTSQPTYVSIAPRFGCQNLVQALAFYGQPGCDPFGNLIVFAEGIPEEEAGDEQGA